MQVFILENVEGLVTKHPETLKAIVSALRAESYRVDVRVLNTADHGIPQNRPRVYICGLRHDVDDGARKRPVLSCLILSRLSRLSLVPSVHQFTCLSLFLYLCPAVCG